MRRMLLQTRYPHCPSSFLWSNQTQTEPIPRSVSPFWPLAQTVGIWPQKMVRVLSSLSLASPRSWQSSHSSLCVCLRSPVCRQHGQCGLGVGPAEDEPGGRVGADVSCALLSVGSQTAPFGAVHRKHQTVPVVTGRMCLGSSPDRR